MRYHLTPVIRATIKKTRITSTGEDVEERKPSCAVDENVSGAAAMENSMEILQKIKNITTI